MDNERTATERALAGCMALDPRAIDEAIAAGVTADSITDPLADAIVTAAIARRETTRPVDVITLHADSGATVADIEACMDSAVTPAHAGHYAAMIAGWAEIDRYAALSRWIATRTHGARPEEASTIGAQIAAEVDRALQAGRTLDARTLAAAAVAWLDRATAPDDACVLLDWPLDVIDNYLGRLDREIVWIVAQPSVGKTAFLLQWLLRLAKQGHRVSMASMESGIEAIASRAVACQTPLNNYPIRQRRADPELIRAAYQTARALPAGLRVTEGSMTLDQLYAWGRAEARKGSRLLAIDNSRHIRVRGNLDRVNEVAEISSRIKQLRDDTGVPVVVLHHSTIDKKTGREDVSWSSDIRKDTDMLVFLKADPEMSREPLRPGDPGLWAVLFRVDKNRDAGAGFSVRLRFRKEWQRFEAWTALDGIDADGGADDGAY